MYFHAPPDGAFHRSATLRPLSTRIRASVGRNGRVHHNVGVDQKERIVGFPFDAVCSRPLASCASAAASAAAVAVPVLPGDSLHENIQGDNVRHTHL